MSEDQAAEKPKKIKKAKPAPAAEEKAQEAPAQEQQAAEAAATSAEPAKHHEHKPRKAPKKQGAKEGFWAVGRRKTAVARVFLFQGDGSIFINDKTYEDYVSNRHRLLAEIMKPFVTVNVLGAYSADIKADGGGICSQAEAVKLGIARALVKMNGELKSALGKAGCLVRDSRAKERKKYGLKKARKRFQYSKR